MLSWRAGIYEGTRVSPLFAPTDIVTELSGSGVSYGSVVVSVSPTFEPALPSAFQ